MLSVNDAIDKLIASAPRLAAVEPVEVLQGLGRVLAENVVAAVDVPPADNSAMDGYVFSFADAQTNGFSLRYSASSGQRIPAGSAPLAITPGCAARIFTGAEIPAGADTVAMQENCSEEEGRVNLDGKLMQGANVRRRGQDIQAGQTILTAGTVLRAQEMGLLSSIGVKTVNVYRPLKVAFFSAGNELVDPGTALQAGQIYNSNRATLTGLIQSLGMVALDLGTVPDNLADTEAVLKKASEQGDIVCSAGGVSVGDEDYVKQAVANLGAIDFWKVAIKPGKPLAFGHVGTTPFIGLPGNPASVFVTFMVLARPFLRACQGLQPKTATSPLRARADFAKEGETREVYLRGRMTDTGVDIYPNQSSGVLASACWGDVFIKQASGENIAIGDWVNVIPYER